MKSSISAFFFILTLLIPPILKAQNSKVQIEKQPDWITTNHIDYRDQKLDHVAEDGFIDLVFEKQVSIEQQSLYTRKAIRIISDAGVENSSEISVEYDPSYSRLSFHSVKIFRGTEIINQLQLSKIRTLQQEMEMERHIYNGTLTSVLLLEDVRKGDVIEYSYTIKGFNPIFGGKYSGSFQTSFSVPVYNVYYKILTPRKRNLNMKNSTVSLLPVINNFPNEVSYEWRLDQVHALRVEDRVPSWYQAYSEINVSEFKSWEDVNRWALLLFNDQIVSSTSLKLKIEEFRIAGGDPEKQVLASLRFVQDGIRYLGIEIGENSHRPANPNKVFTQRFGDCKDKAYLFCTILGALGIEARPVLVNTIFAKAIKEWLPSPTAFDHVTVRVKLKDSVYWLDPTNTHQRGMLSDISYPDYGYGLVIEPNTTALTFIPFSEPGMVKVNEVFEIPSSNRAAKLKVKTEYSGSFADDVRRSFENNSRYQIQKDFHEYYVQYFEKIKSDSLVFTDNEKTGTFITEEHYTIPEIWTVEKGVKKSLFSPFVINGIMKRPKDANRTMPFSLDFPARYKEVIEINLPEEWDAEEYDQDFSCSGIFFKAKFRSDYRKIRLIYDYEALRDHVLPAEAHDFLEGYKKAERNIGYELSKTQDNSFTYGKNVFESDNDSTTIKLIFLVLIVGVIIWLLRNK
jgi:Domain of Unknown Function with PDB structure (DUF3857)/Transglutaminase-like superfamily